MSTAFTDILLDYFKLISLIQFTYEYQRAKGIYSLE